MIARAELIVMVSHDMESLRKFCRRGLWMDHGRVRLDGSHRTRWSAAYTECGPQPPRGLMASATGGGVLHWIEPPPRRFTRRPTPWTRRFASCRF